MILILVLLIVLAVILILRPWKQRGCRWRQDTRKLADGRVLFTCAACGAEIALPKGREPRDCLAGEMK
jgi:preprotein translocase subunit YajC